LTATFNHSLSVLNRKEKRQFFFLAGLQLVITLLDILFLAVLVGIANDIITDPANLDKGLLPFHQQLSWPLTAGIVLVLFLVKNLAGYRIQQSQFRFVYATATRLSALRIRAYLSGDYNQYAGTDSAAHIRQISQLPVEFSHYILYGYQQIIVQVFLLILAGAAILVYKPFLFLLLLAFLLPTGFLLFWLMKKKMHRAREGARQKSEQALQHLKESLAGFVESNIYDANDFFANRYVNSQHLQNKWLAGIQSLQVLPGRLTELFAIAAFFLLIAFSKPGNELFLVIGFFLAAAYKIIPGIAKIAAHYSQVMAYQHTIEFMLPATTVAAPVTSNSSVPLLKTIAFENISFSYGDKPVLYQFSSIIQSGQLTGLEADSGKGKTTLLNILLGFLEPQEGAVFFNGNKTTAAERRLYWPQLALIKQDGFLLHDTLLNNITLGKEIKDKDHLKKSIEQAGLQLLIGQHEKGLAQLITENGKNISGGQRQRISLARALYKNAGVLLADEPFSELDETAEKEGMQYLHDLATGGSIVLLITHNRQSLAQCHQIISLHAR
jgi:ABC-type multidrug transport system fused ATPase/permease subunit